MRVSAARHLHLKVRNADRSGEDGTAVSAPAAPPASPEKSSSPSRRLIGVDACRGIALLGMIAVHVLPETNARGEPTWLFTLFGGRAAAAFAVLAGVGIAFMTGRTRVRRADLPATAAMLATRAVLIGVIGLALGYTDASLGVVILEYYAVLFVFAIPLVALRSSLVATVGGLCTVFVPVITHVLLPHLPGPDLENPTVTDLATRPMGLLSELSVNGEYPAVAWITYLCAGLVIGRLSLSDVRTGARLLGGGAALTGLAALGSTLLLNEAGGLADIWAAQPHSPLDASETAELLSLQGDGTTPPSTWWWLAVNSPHTSTPFDLLGTTGSSAALLGAMLLVAHVRVPVLRRVIRFAQVPLAAAGSMTLSCYTAHIVFINSDVAPDDPALSYAVQAVGAVLLTLGWQACVGRGPLERFVAELASRVKRRVADRWPRDSAPVLQR